MKLSNLYFALALASLSSPLLADGNTEIDSNATITTGQNNTLIGVDAGRSITTASGNTMLGNQAGYNNIADENVFGGYQAGYLNTVGERNTFLGKQAGYSNVSGEDNTFFGNTAGYSNTGSRNTFLGDESGYSNTSGNDNTFIGVVSGYQISTGYRNTGVGHDALRAYNRDSSAEDNAWGNTVFGSQAGFALSDGIRNTLIGTYAGYDMGFGHFNTMIGTRAGENTENADYNTFVGMLAGRDNNRQNGETTANRNTYLGVAAGASNRVGSDNVVLGAFADFMQWTATDEEKYDDFSGSWNVAANVPNAPYMYEVNRVTVLGGYAVGGADEVVVVGHSAQATENATGGSIVVGVNAVVSHANSVVIGNNASSHGDNTVVLGNDATELWSAYSDVKTTLGAENYRFKDAFVKTTNVIAATDSDAALTLTADNGEDNGDSWQVKAADNGDLSFNNNASGNYVEQMKIANNGDLIISGDLTLASDERLKKDIKPISNGLEIVQQLQGKSYRWKEHLGRSNDRQYGFIAQEVEAVIPELIRNDKYGIKSVNYVEVTPFLIAAMKELTAESQSIEQETVLLEKEIEQLAQHAGL